LEKGGEHAETLDIKKGGTAAVVQMARLFTVAAGLPQLSTRERLAASAGAGSVSRQGAQDLADAFEFLCTVQLHHQQAQFNAGEQPNNHIYPKRLSSLEREHLRDAFGVIRKLQQSLGAKYPIRAMS
ncbi:putative nucleotidyltransferase substrate binding domain-containing protein, partial [Corynebacterium sp.]